MKRERIRKKEEEEKNRGEEEEKKVLWWSLLSKKLISRVKVSQLGIYRCVSGPIKWELASWALNFISFTCWFFSSLWYWGLPGGTLGWWRWPQGRGVASCLSSFRPSLKWQSNSMRWPKFDHVWAHEGQQHRESILEWSASHDWATYVLIGAFFSFRCQFYLGKVLIIAFTYTHNNINYGAVWVEKNRKCIYTFIPSTLHNIFKINQHLWL